MKRILQRRIFKSVGQSLLVLLGFALVLAASSARAQTYSIVVYEPPAGFEDTTGEGIAGLQSVGGSRLNGETYPNRGHAFLWTSKSTLPIDLHPPGWEYSKANDTDGKRQVGYVLGNSGYTFKAALWSGSASSFISLCEPPQCFNGSASGIGGDQQVGYLDNGFTCSECGPYGDVRAVLWRGTPQSIVSLHPPFREWQLSEASETDGFQQVGYGIHLSTDLETTYRALLWSGTRESFVDLRPAGWKYSYAVAVKNNVQVGDGNQFNNGGSLSPTKALVWHGTAASVVVLGDGRAYDTNGATHVGAKFSNSSPSRAFRWDGDTGAGVDLHELLPPGVFTSSSARAIDAAGNVFGTARLPSGRVRTVQWRVNKTTRTR